MTMMWLFTATCMYLIIPKITFVGISNARALIILTARSCLRLSLALASLVQILFYRRPLRKAPLPTRYGNGATSSKYNECARVRWRECKIHG